MTTFTERLARQRARAGLSRMEGALWYGVPKSTYENWLRGVEPHSYTRREVERGMRDLDKELTCKKPRLPIPVNIRQQDRADYVRRIRGIDS